MKLVMVFGAFDVLHPGHLNLFQQARRYGDRLLVVVARDVTIRRVKRHEPFFSERQRLANVRLALGVDHVVLGSRTDPFAVIRRYRPNVICLGYDQNSFVKNLKNTFPHVKIIRLKSYMPRTYKSSKLKK